MYSNNFSLKMQLSLLVLHLLLALLILVHIRINFIKYYSKVPFTFFLYTHSFLYNFNIKQLSFKDLDIDIRCIYLPFSTFWFMTNIILAYLNTTNYSVLPSILLILWPLLTSHDKPFFDWPSLINYWYIKLLVIIISWSLPC